MSVDQPMVEMRYSSLSAMSNEEIEAQTLIKRGEIDQAIMVSINFCNPLLVVSKRHPSLAQSTATQNTRSNKESSLANIDKHITNLQKGITSPLCLYQISSNHQR